MEHFTFNETPIQNINVSYMKGSIKCKRDDLFTGGFGGSKARMLKYILYPIKKKNCEVILTAGGPCSNFNRALSVYCAEMNIKLRIVSYTENKEQYQTSLNYRLSKMMGAEYIYCEKKDVKDVLEYEKEILNREGINYEYIYGGAEGNLAGMMAYYDAVEELRRQTDNIKHIFLPCGTGTTVSGICAGVKKYYPKAVVHAISVARTKDKELQIIDKNRELLCQEIGESFSYDNLVFYDEFLDGGYSSYSEKVWHTILELSRSSGIVLDPIYSGKAFSGMVSILLEEMSSLEGVLFWNTGGLINFLSCSTKLIEEG